MKTNTLQTDMEAEELPEATAPTDIRTVFQAGQILLMLLAACYFAGEIILPVILYLTLNLVLQPVMLVLEMMHVKQTLSVLTIIAILIGNTNRLSTARSAPNAANR